MACEAVAASCHVAGREAGSNFVVNAWPARGEVALQVDVSPYANSTQKLRNISIKMTRCVCAVSNCRKSSYVHNQLKFIRIPSAPNICKQWLRLIGQPEYKCRDKHNMYICEEHFKPEDRTETKMRPNVLPSLNLPLPSAIEAQPSTRMMANKGTQYRAPGSSGAATMKKSIGYKSPKQQRLEKKTQFEKLCDEFLSRDVSNLVRLQVEIKKQFHKDKYFKDFKYFCLKFYYTSPASYIALQTYYNLSDVKGLLRSCLSFAAQDRKPFLATLCSKIDCMTDLEKNCAVLISEVDLKPHLYYNVTEDKIYGYCESTEQTQDPQLARRAIILMARGLYGRWVLPIDYGLFYEKDNSPIKKWVMSVLEQLISAGLKIRVCVSNMSSKELIAGDQHFVSIEKPFFSVSQSICYVYDPTYLVTKVLSYLLDHEIHFDGCVAKWADLVYFYESDSKKELRLAPELSVKHIKPNDGKIEARVAIETLSESVAAGISAYIDFGQMDESARGTVQLLVMMNRLYKFMSSSNASNTCEYQKPQSGSDFQTKFVIEALGFFRRLKLLKDGIDVTQNVKIFQEIQIAIRAEVLLYEDLMMENLPNLCNNIMRLNILDKFLNRIREKSKLGDITVWRLISAHRKMLLRNFSKTGKQKNCPKAVSEMFEEYLKSTRFGSFSYAFDRVPAKRFKVAALILPVKISEYKNLKLPRDHKIIHISMFLLEKCLSMHEICNLPQPKQILKTEDFSRACAVFELDLNADHQRIPIPDNNMINFVEVLEQNLKRQFSAGVVINQPFRTLSATAEQFVPTYEPPCQCFPVLYFIKLFYRLRISQILKDANRSYKECSSGSDMQFKYIQLE